MFKMDRIIAFLIGIGAAYTVIPWLLSLVGMRKKLGMQAAGA